MLEFSDKHFKAAVIKCFGEQLQICWKQRKNRRSQHTNKRYKENKIEILELKNRISEIKSSVGGLNSKIKETEDRIGELKDETVEIAQFEQWRKNKLEKITRNRASGICETINKRSNIYVIRGP